MPTYVKTDYVPPRSRKWLIQGKEYQVNKMRNNSAEITDEQGDEILICILSCAFLDGGAWTVINRP